MPSRYVREQLPPAASGNRNRRLGQILDLVAVRGTVSLADLTSTLGISPATVRRDLAALADRRLLVRTHGGARLIEAGYEMPVSMRDQRFPQAKRAIAREVAELIPQRRFAVGLSGGTTAAQVVRAVAGHDQLTVVTNSLTIAQLVTSFPRLKVIMTGGMVRPESLELVGVLAENTFKAVNLGLAVVGADGVTAAGVTTHDETEARTNNAMVEHAQRVVVAADGSKIGRLAMAKVTGLDRVSLLITDDSAPPAAVAEIRAAGCEVRVVVVTPDD